MHARECAPIHQVRALCHEAVQRVVRGEDVAVRREGSREGHIEEARGYAHFKVDTLSLHLPGQEAVGLDQLVSVEHLPLSQSPSLSARLSERAARAVGSTCFPASSTSLRTSGCRASGSASGDSSRADSPARYRNAVRLGFIDAQGGDRSLHIYMQIRGLDSHILYSGSTCVRVSPPTSTHTLAVYQTNTVGRSLEIQLGGAASRDGWYEGLGLLCGAVP